MSHGPVHEDPAIARFNSMREGAYAHFQWTPRTIRTATLGIFIIPGALFYVANATHMRWNWNAKLKGESLDA